MVWFVEKKRAHRNQQKPFIYGSGRKSGGLAFGLFRGPAGFNTIKQCAALSLLSSIWNCLFLQEANVVDIHHPHPTSSLLTYTATPDGRPWQEALHLHGPRTRWKLKCPTTNICMLIYTSKEKHNLISTVFLEPSSSIRPHGRELKALRLNQQLCDYPKYWGELSPTIWWSRSRGTSSY